MPGCTDAHYRKMLHAWELGLLTDDERHEMELHMLECSHCFEEARKFGGVVHLLHRDREIRATVEKLAEAQTTDVRKKTSGKRSLRTKMIRTSLVAAAVLALLVLQPWQVQIRTTDEAVAYEDRLAIMKFENLADSTDKDRLGQIAANLLITDLSESEYVQVLSSQRITDILRFLGQDETSPPDHSTASTVASRAHARWMILGSILQTDPEMVITSQLVDVATGKVLASQRVTGSDNESIFDLVDQLTVEIKADLVLPVEAGSEPDPRVAEVTTHSPEAYRYYLEGQDLVDKMYLTDAPARFQKALEYDSTFAMAYYYLSTLVDRRLIEKAVQYSANIGERDRLFIMSQAASVAGNSAEAIELMEAVTERWPDDKEAWYGLAILHAAEGNSDKVVRYAERAVEIDPLYKQAYNRLAYSYDDIGEFDKSIMAINKYIELAPDEANPYDSRGELYYRSGKIELAIDSYRKALERKPDFYWSLDQLCRLYLLRGEFAQAESCFVRLGQIDHRFMKAAARIFECQSFVHRGQFRQALTLLDKNLAADSLGGLSRHRAEKYFIKARVQAEIGEFESALLVMDSALNLTEDVIGGDSPGFRNYLALLLAEAGRFEQAAEVAEGISADSTGQRLCAAGSIELLKGNISEAMRLLKEAAAEHDDFPTLYLSSRACLEGGRLGDAVDGFERAAEIHDRWKLRWNIWAVKVHYYLGLAYEESRWHDKARTQYERFLTLWQDADEGIPEIADARQRLEQLKTGS